MLSKRRVSIVEGSFVGGGTRPVAVNLSMRMLAYGLVFVRLIVPAAGGHTAAVLPSGILVVETLEASTPLHVAAASPSTPWGWIVYVVGALAVAVSMVVASLRERAQLRRSEDGVGMDDAPVAIHATAGPCVVGVMRPRVLVPTWFERLPVHVQRCVLAHERAHVRGRDPWIVAAVRGALVLAWPILPCWLAARRIRALLEVRADAGAVAHEGLDPHDYARALVGLASLGVPTPMPSLSSFRALAERVVAVRTMARGSRSLGVLLFAAAGAATACSAREVMPSLEVTLSAEQAAAASAEGEAKPADLVRLESSDVVEVETPPLAWGTPATIASLEAAARRFAERYPDTPVKVRDISRRRGGFVPPHRTHREGREVDIDWPVDPDGELAASQAWSLLEALLASGNIERVTVDPGVCNPLREAGRHEGASDELLASLDAGCSEEPGTGSRHVHVRFAK